MTAAPRGKLADVPPAVRRLWSLLYRATRQRAVDVDRLDRRVANLYGYATHLVAEHRRDLAAHGGRVNRLEARLAELEEVVRELRRRPDDDP